jgi:hypothetical protein
MHAKSVPSGSKATSASSLAVCLNVRNRQAHVMKLQCDIERTQTLRGSANRAQQNHSPFPTRCEASTAAQLGLSYCLHLLLRMGEDW